MILYKEECFAVQSAVFEVYRQMGHGFLEPIYQECLEREFIAQGIPYIAQPELQISYKGQVLKQFYKPDFICFEKIIVEIKSVKDIVSEHKAQAINYLKATGMRLALLVNFGSHPKAEVVRIVL